MTGLTREQTRSAYDTVAASYAQMLPDTRYEASVDLGMLDHFIERIGEGAPAKVLDAGCGTGRMVTALQSRNASLRITGVDLSPGMIEQAAAAHPELPFLQGDLTALPLADAEFDGLLAWYSVIHVAPHELSAVFEEFARVLRPGGYVLLGYQAGTGDRAIPQPYGHDVELRAFLHHTPYVEAALGGAGFQVRARLDREPRPSERHAQGFVLAQLP